MLTAAQKKTDADRRRLSRLWLRRQKENDPMPAAPHRNPCAALAAADSPSATGNSYASSPSNGSGA